MSSFRTFGDPGSMFAPPRRISDAEARIRALEDDVAKLWQAVDRLKTQVDRAEQINAIFRGSFPAPG